MLTVMEAAPHALTGLWFILVAVLWIGFFFLEGFDFGVAMLLPVLGRTDERKRVMVNTIGPVWDGNEVWLLTAGGATFAAFPGWYATLFSGLYLPLLLVLVGLIIRGVAFEYRSKHPGSQWRNAFDWMATIGSFLPSLVLGVGFANFVRGLRVAGNPPLVTTSFWGLFTPFALLGGVMFVVLFCAHGAIFLALKTKGEIQRDAQALAAKLALVAAVVVGVFAIAMNAFYGPSNGAAHGLTWATSIVAAACLVVAWRLSTQSRDGLAFIAGGLTIVLLMVSIFTKMWGNIGFVPAAGTHFDMWVASSTKLTLTVMSIAAGIFVPIVLAYQAWSYWVFRRRLSVENLPLETGTTRAAVTA